jgi:hypothetical protein
MRNIWLLVKFFSEERHADEFLSGKLFLNRLSYFQKLEEECTDGRSDITEAIKMWFQPSDTYMSLSVPGIGTVKITPQDLAAPVSVTNTNADYLHVFCMYAIYTSEPLSNSTTIEDRQRLAQELKQKLSIDDRCLKFRPFAVIIPAFQFLNQMQEKLRAQGYRFQAKLVDYYDDKSFSGEFSDSDTPFKKQVRFAYQREYRIAVESSLLASNPITIDIGPIDNLLAKKVESSGLNSILKSAAIQPGRPE